LAGRKAGGIEATQLQTIQSSLALGWCEQFLKLRPEHKVFDGQVQAATFPQCSETVRSL
tara:strand:- start:302 stop:478 length:177 start_codon:yes stop_codon:yes gene_type:complete